MDKPNGIHPYNEMLLNHMGKKMYKYNDIDESLKCLMLNERSQTQ